MKVFELTGKFGPLGVGLLFIWAGIFKVLNPGEATLALESLEIPHDWAKVLVSAIIVLELYLGTLLLLRMDLRFGLSMTIALLLLFTGFLWYLSTMANPPSCGCLGLTGIFDNNRQAALFGVARNFALICIVKVSYDHYCKAPISAPTEPTAG